MKPFPLGDGSNKTNNKLLVRHQLHCVQWVLDTCLALLVRFWRMTLMQHLEKWWYSVIIEFPSLEKSSEGKGWKFLNVVRA